MEEKLNVLLVEDDPNFGLILRDYLTIKGYEVTLSRDGIHGLNDFKSNDFALCILDVMMPRKDGYSLAKQIKEINPQMPIIFLTAKSLKEDMIKGYEAGADDYIIKPFDSEVLELKIQAILNRQSHVGKKEDIPEEMEIGKFKLNTQLRIMEKDGDERKLSPKENALLILLALNMNRLVTRKDALLKIWKEDNYFTARSMDVYLAKLRKYIAPDPNLEIVNIHGEGFRLVNRG
ncbi:MAG: response regulator transcription factor [Cryomorphaceae bacterium]|nr:response regulator transcription factor [Cryomorphaceae bacterium]